MGVPIEFPEALAERLRSKDTAVFRVAQTELLEAVHALREGPHNIFLIARMCIALNLSRPNLDTDVQAELFDTLADAVIAIEGTAHLSYTNMVLYEIYGVIAGAQLLGDRATEARGKKRFLSWVNLASTSWGTAEFMSPTYSSTTTGALRALRENQDDLEIRLKAQIMMERWWLHIALHYHFPMREVAAPFSRCYNYPSIGSSGLLTNRIRTFFGWETFYDPKRNEKRRAEPTVTYMPGYIEQIMLKKTFPCCFREVFRTGLRSGLLQEPGEWLEMLYDHPKAPGVFIMWQAEQWERADFIPKDWGTTWLASGVTLGSRSYRHEPYNESFAMTPISIVAQMFNAKSWRPNHEFFCRYWNEAGETVGRGSVFRSCQNHNVALVSHHIDTVASGTAIRPLGGIKTTRLMQFWAFEDLEQIDGLWVDGENVTELPRQVGMGSIIMVKDGTAWIGLRPIFLRGIDGIETRMEIVRTRAKDAMCREPCLPAGVEVEPGSVMSLQFRLIHYEGPARNFSFAELESALAMSAIEVHEANVFPSMEAFHAHLQRAEIRHEGCEHVYVSADNMTVELNEDRDPTRGAPKTCPADLVESPYVCANNTGVVVLGNARLEASQPTPLTLVHAPDSDKYVILHIANQPAVDLTFSINDHSINILNAGFGRYIIHPAGSTFTVERFTMGEADLMSG